MKLFHNTKGVDMQDWFGIVFSVVIGAFVFFGMAGLLMVTAQHEKTVLKEITSVVDDSFFLMTYVRTPLSSQTIEGEEENKELSSVQTYLAEEGLTMAQLIDIVGNKKEAKALFHETRAGIPEEMRTLSDEEVEGLLEQLLDAYNKDLFTARYGVQGWSLIIDYPEQYRNDIDIIHDTGGLGGGRATEITIPTIDGKNVITIRLVRNIHAVVVRP
ncbi:hypothetical protein HYS47_03560 [Candidatus Woesearchaeota archaeon]|nr:hypothetical protein [Candidatus Woesearchaeota archaeon]